MAIFFPPTPAAFTGGAQPYAPRTLPPAIAAVPANNPPFGLPEAAAIATAVVATAQPAPWQYVFYGGVAGRQPYGPRQLCPAITAVPANNPPFGLPETIATAALSVATAQPPAWPYVHFGAGQPFAPKQNSPAIPGQSADPPPFTHRGLIPATAEEIALTQPNPWQYVFFGGPQPFGPKTLSAGIPGQSADPPPFDLRAGATKAESASIAQPDPWTFSYFGAGQPFAPKTLSPAIPGQSADPPPFDLRKPVTGVELVTRWQPDPWVYAYAGAGQPFAPRRLPAVIMDVVMSVPPFDRRSAQQRAELTSLWQPDPWVYDYYGGRQPFDPRRVTVSVTYLPPRTRITIIN